MRFLLRSLPGPRRTSEILSTLLLATLFFALSACGPGATGGKRADASGGTDGAGTDGGATDGTDGEDGTDGTGGTDGTDGSGTDGTDGGDGTDGTEPQFEGIAGFPSEELFLQIVGPSAYDHVATGGGLTYLAGILFGNADKIVWQASSGAAGEAKGDQFWKTGPISLSPGDNTVVVKAIGLDGKQESVDTIVVTYNPGFYFADAPVVRPAGFFTGKAVDVVVTMPIRTKNFLPSTVTLVEVDANGNTIQELGKMVDTGDTTNPNCDEIQDDSVFSRCVQMQSASPAVRYLRGTLKVQTEGSLHTVFTPIVPIEIVSPFSTAECQQLHTVQKEARATYDSELAAGTPNPSAAVVEKLKADPLVASAGMSSNGTGIWVEFSSGVLGALNIPTEGNRGGSDGGGQGDGGHGTQTGALVGNLHPIESKNVLALAPFASELGPVDETPQIASLLDAQVCPKLTVDGPHKGVAATLARLRAAYEYGVLVYSGHADAYFTTMEPSRKAALRWEHDGSQEILWTGEPIACGELSSAMESCTPDAGCAGQAECVITKSNGNEVEGICIDKTQVDLRHGRVVMGAETWGVHPQFFLKHAKRQWPSTLVYLGACRTLFSGTLAGALFGAGAKAIAGFTGYVRSTFASEQAKKWFSAMLEEEVPSGGAALFPVADPDNPSGHFALFGGSNVFITDSEIINAGFEMGEVTGWNVEGDGRVISQLGISVPVGGKFMGVLSTGLGYTQQTGELNQSFCIPEGVQELTFYWKFFSEEFKEWCGSIYQDTFQATLESGSGALKLVDTKVDDLCAPTDGDCGWGGICGSQYVGLIASDVSFDQGGVYNIQWQELKKNVSQLAGKGPVTLRLFTTDQGDSIYDTVILIDSIQFE